MSKEISPDPAQVVPIEGLDRTIVLVGLMGAGKTTVGWRLAKKTGLSFLDSDKCIEEEAGCSIPELFEAGGEAYFRNLEHEVIRRILTGAPSVLATGGGAFMHPATRELIKEKGISVWLKASLDVLVERVSRRGNARPLLDKGDKREILEKLMSERYPIYAEADITIDSDQGHHFRTVGKIINEVKNHINS